MAVDGEMMPVSRLIDIAAERGLQANPVRLDWHGLQTAVNNDPLLVLLKNANVVAVVSNGFHGPDEIVVSDPLKGGGELLYVPRSELERGWDGDALIVAPQPVKRERSFFWMIFLLCVGVVLSAAVLLLPREIQMRVATSDPPARGASAVTARETSAIGASTQPQPGNARNDVGTAVPMRADEAKAPDRLAATPTAAAGPPPKPPAVTAKPEPKPKAEPKAEATAPVATPATATALPEARPPASQTISQSPSQHTTAAPPAEPTAAPGAVAKAIPPIAPPVAAPVGPGPAGTSPLVAALPPASREVAAPAPTAPGAKPPQSAPIETVSREPPKPNAPEIEALVARGDALIGVADVASARLFYERAAEAGHGLAALRLGETYDPQFLARARLGRVRGDPALAIHWYKRARELGVSAAEILLNSAESK